MSPKLRGQPLKNPVLIKAFAGKLDADKGYIFAGLARLLILSQKPAIKYDPVHTNQFKPDLESNSGS